MSTASTPAPKDHIIKNTQPDGRVLWICGDALLTTDRAQALRMTKQDAEERAARLAKVVNGRRSAEGIAGLQVYTAQAVDAPLCHCGLHPQNKDGYCPAEQTARECSGDEE